MQKLLATLGLLVAFFCCVSPQMAKAQVIGRMNVDSFPIYDWSVYPTNGLTYGLTWLPASYASNPSKKYPVIFNLEGQGQLGNGVAGLSNLLTDGYCKVISGGVNPVATNPIDKNSYEFIVVTPQTPSGGWSYLYDQMKYIVPSVLKRYRIDSSRVYLHGLSSGGDGVLTCITVDSNFTKLFAAAAIGSGAAMDGCYVCSPQISSQQLESNLKYTASKYGVGVWLCFGDQDPRNNAMYEDSLNWFKPAMPAKMTELAGVGHSAWNQQESTFFRPIGNYYGSKAETFVSQPNTNGSAIPGIGKTQDSLNMLEWFLTFQRGKSASSGGSGSNGGATGGGGSVPPGARKPQRWKIVPGVLPNIAPAGDVAVNIPAGALIPGDTVEISNAYAWTYGAIKANGTQASPIVIINSGTGPATFTGGFTIRGQYIHMTGTGVAGLLDGFMMTNPTPHNRSQGPFAVTITDSSAYVEVDHLNIYHTGIGFNVKNENSCDPGLQYPAWTIAYIDIHDNRIVGIWNEGLYLGNTSPDNAANSYDPRPVTCNGVTVYPRPLRIGHIHVHHNFIDSCGRGGLQLESCDTSMSEIDNNTVLHSGMNSDNSQGTGISVGAYARAYVHDDTIKYTYTWSFGGLGFDTVRFENNHCDSAGFLNGYNLSNTSAQVVNTDTMTVIPNTQSWVQSFFGKTVPTLSGDSSVLSVYNNQFGTCRMMSQQIDLLDQYGLYKKNGASVFCGNTGANGPSPINLETPTISYSLCPGGSTGSGSGGCPVCPTCPTCPAPRKATSVLLNGVWVPLTGVSIKYDDGTTVNQ